MNRATTDSNDEVPLGGLARLGSDIAMRMSRKSDTPKPSSLQTSSAVLQQTGVLTWIAGETEQRASSAALGDLDLQAPPNTLLDKQSGLRMLQSTQQRSLKDQMLLMQAAIEDLRV